MRLRTDTILSPAETRVASGYVSGMIGKEIADAAGISHNTVVRHTQHIYDKARCPRSTNALVAWFLATNYGIDLAEFRRRVGAALLLVIVSTQMLTDWRGEYLRSAGARTVAARKGGRRTREDDDTIDINTI